MPHHVIQVYIQSIENLQFYYLNLHVVRVHSISNAVSCKIVWLPFKNKFQFWNHIAFTKFTNGNSMLLHLHILY